MSRKSRSAAGAQMTGLASDMLRASLLDHVLDNDFFAVARVEFDDTDGYLGPELPQGVDLLQKFATDVLLRLLRKGCGFDHSEL